MKVLRVVVVLALLLIPCSLAFGGEGGYEPGQPRDLDAIIFPITMQSIGLVIVAAAALALLSVIGVRVAFRLVLKVLGAFRNIA